MLYLAFCLCLLSVFLIHCMKGVTDKCVSRYKEGKISFARSRVLQLKHVTQSQLARCMHCSFSLSFSAVRIE